MYCLLTLVDMYIMRELVAMIRKGGREGGREGGRKGGRRREENNKRMKNRCG